MKPPMQPPLGSIAVTFGGIAVIGGVDFATGAELRVFPLYFVPLSLAAWQAGRTWATFVALCCSAAWLTSNWLAGLQFSSRFILAVNSAAHATAFVLIGYLVSTLRRSLLRERELSHTDALTGLGNRRRLESELARAIAVCRRHQRPISMAFLDVDDFKRINDAHGHAAGDVVLRTVGRVLEQATRAMDCVARIGGDEFAVLLPEAGADAARAFAARLREALDATLARAAVPATVSVGAVVFARAPESVHALVREADAAMYAVKREGKDRVRIVELSDQGPSLTTAAS